MVVAISSTASVRIFLTFQTASCNSILAGCRLRDFPVQVLLAAVLFLGPFAPCLFVFGTAKLSLVEKSESCSASLRILLTSLFNCLLASMFFLSARKRVELMFR